MGATYYILERHPDLRETPAGIITRAEQEACPGATDARAFVHAIREIAPEPPSSALRHALLGIAAAFFFLRFFFLHGGQDIILEEIVAALPVCAGCAVRLIETLAKSEGWSRRSPSSLRLSSAPCCTCWRPAVCTCPTGAATTGTPRRAPFRAYAACARRSAGSAAGSGRRSGSAGLRALREARRERISEGSKSSSLGRSRARGSRRSGVLAGHAVAASTLRNV